MINDPILKEKIMRKIELGKMYIILGTLEEKVRMIRKGCYDDDMKELSEAKELDFKSFKNGAEQYTFEICDEIRDLIEQEIGMEAL